MRIINLSFLLIVVLLGVIFTVLNFDLVTIHYYFGQRVVPLVLLLVVTFILGCFLGIVVVGWFLIKVKLSNYRLRRRLLLAEKEIENLRAIPLQDNI